MRPYTIQISHGLTSLVCASTAMTNVMDLVQISIIINLLIFNDLQVLSVVDSEINEVIGLTFSRDYARVMITVVSAWKDST